LQSADSDLAVNDALETATRHHGVKESEEIERQAVEDRNAL
jgi:hypothetical protein